MNARAHPFALLVLLCGQLLAQTVPPLINYQGQLLGAGGTNLPTADYQLTFNVYDTAQGGDPVWGPQIFDGRSGAGYGPKIPVVQGYFNVMLGPADTRGRSLAEAFTTANRWVEIKVDDHNPIAPRQQILSAPFALVANQARTAQSIGGGVLTTTDDGRVGIGTAAPASRLHVHGNSGEVAIYVGSGDDSAGRMKLRYDATEKSSLITSWSTDGYKPLSLEGSTLALNANTAGGVGIGTSTPAEKLHVAGNARVDGDLKVAGTRFRELAPAGSIVAFGGPNCPTGWLLCNGAAVSRTEYAGLFAAIGTSWGNGDGVNTFNLPDLRGEFVRGLDQGRGVDGGRVFASPQPDGIRNHVHRPTVVSGYNEDDKPKGGFSRAGTGQEDSTANSGPMLATGPYPAAAAETRPRNVAVIYIIKY